ncbi:hypothetical protein ABAC460_17845 [Asticcacaulis sp. AC460]|uniref:nSTAND3 domain-containing NTPase n=1 Tax=Asticcacaulis sp. AC460 TaxID=1282360 RepID=UPI0003C3D93B|nr:HEAT repeat domain-containing protein [Asticcacaulis sp. AC460]ESQ88056.1 hypothetical protein ABAC460_17845 [Asticcacaulis sp. AC460]
MQEDDTGGANPSYRGYDYQKLVTVWIALELMWGDGATTQEIIVEPASHDDVKARLDVPAEDADAHINIGSVELHVQIKFKGAGHWSAKEFAAVVNDKEKAGSRGPAVRERAKSLLLKNPNRRYLFITNTSVDAALAAGRVATPAGRPLPTFLPTSLNLRNDADKSSLAGRFAIIELLTPTEVLTRIGKLLTHQLHLPSHKIGEAVERLKKLVEDRFLEVPDPLRKTDIAKVVEGLGGLPHPDADLAHYIQPKSREDVDRALASYNSVLLIGPSGYGKSLTAKSLAYDRRIATPPFEVIRETSGIAAIEEALAKAGRFFFYLDDPWGQTGLNREEAARWTRHLPALLRKASPDKQFVITSRTEVFRLAMDGNPAPIWTDISVTIDDEAYDERTRREILEGKLLDAASWQRDLAREHEVRVLDTLRSPMELDGFTRQLKLLARPEFADVSQLIDRAQTEGRKQVVSDQVRGFGDPGLRGAAVLWALMRFSRDVAPGRLRSLRRAIERVGLPDIHLDELAAYMAPTQFTSREDGSYNAHGKVIEALEALLNNSPRIVENTFNAAARAILNLIGSGAEWHDELYRLVSGAKALEHSGVELDADVLDTIDKLLIHALFIPDLTPAQFRKAWQAANWHNSGRSALGRLVHWLERGAPKKDKKGGFADLGWRPPPVSDSDRSDILAADPDGKLLKGFVAHVLPASSQDYDAEQFLPWLKPFGVDLMEAFLEAGNEVANTPTFIMSADTISQGALIWESTPYQQVWTQFEELESAVDIVLTANRENRRKALQGELDFAVQLRILDENDEAGPAPRHFGKGYVRGRRQREGFEWVKTHVRPDEIIPLWAEVMKTDSNTIQPPELEAFFECAGNDEDLHAIGIQVIGDRRLAFAKDRVIAALTSGGPGVQEAALRALNWLERDEDQSDATLFELFPTLDLIKAATLAPLIAGQPIGPTKRAACARKIVEAASADARAAVALALANYLELPNEQTLEAFRLLPPSVAQNLIANGPRRLARLMLIVSAAEGQDVRETAGNWLASDNVQDSTAAMKALSFVQGPEARSMIAGAMKHPDYEVRREALEYLAPQADSPEVAEILNLANDVSALVREKLAETIGQRHWPEGLPILISLLGDTRDYSRHPEHQIRNEPKFAVAQAAATALGKFDALPPEMVDHVIQFLKRRASSSEDVEVHTRLTRLLENFDHVEVWPVLKGLLQDDRVVGGKGENLYPARYAAAWTIIKRLPLHPAEFENAPWLELEVAADHIDPQLAGPALCALGILLANESSGSALAALRGSNRSEIRTALALLMFNKKAEAKAFAVRYSLLPAEHPLWIDEPDLSDTQTKLERWPMAEAGRNWLLFSGSEDDVVPLLQWIARGRTGLDIGDKDFDPDDVKRQETIPIITTSEMFGLE